MKNYSKPTTPASPSAAIQIQRQLREEVILESAFASLDDITRIAGLDVSHTADGLSHAALVLLDFQTLVPLESVRLSMPTSFPYIPGLLSFREIPVLLAGLAQLKQSPDLLMVDGQGVAHPRGLGIAAHLGVLTGLPAIGVAKSKLTGRYDEPAAEKGARSWLMKDDKRIGTVLRSKNKCLPLFISPGHKMDHEQAVTVTWRCLTRYRLPEPTRLADKLSKQKASPSLL